MVIFKKKEKRINATLSTLKEKINDLETKNNILADKVLNLELTIENLISQVEKNKDIDKEILEKQKERTDIFREYLLGETDNE